MFCMTKLNCSLEFSTSCFFSSNFLFLVSFPPHAVAYWPHFYPLKTELFPIVTFFCHVGESYRHPHFYVFLIPCMFSLPAFSSLQLFPYPPPLVVFLRHFELIVLLDGFQYLLGFHKEGYQFLSPRYLFRRLFHSHAFCFFRFVNSKLK